MNTFRTIIIDDETIARNRLASLLGEYKGRFEVVAQAANGIEAVEQINHFKPDLIFLDIQMPGKTGFEVLNDLTHIPQVVFCTAYEEFALQAFNTLALDYLVKPVEAERLQLTLEKLDRKTSEIPRLQVQELLDLVRKQTEDKKLQSVPHKIGDRVLLIKTEKITHFLATTKNVEFYTNDGKRYLTDLSLAKLKERLPRNFVQVQRATIVNVDFIKEFRKYFRGKFILVLDDLNNTRLETGRSFTESIREIMEIE